MAQPPPAIPAHAAKPARLQSLDVFRGLTIAAMLLVNNPGSWANIYAPLRHAEWHGCTPTDLIFPFFLYIVGTAMALGARAPSQATYARIARRTLVLIALGLLLALVPKFELSTLRLPGVLQRIALCYLLGSVLIMHTRVRTQVVVGAGVLLAYSLALRFVPVPGVGPGVLTPEGHLGGFLDRTLLGPHIYKGGPYDPEGLLSTLPATVTLLIGSWTGLWIKRANRDWRSVAGLVVTGALGVGAGLALASFDVPLNKPLWSSAYVLLTAGWALIALAACFAACEVLRWRAIARPLEIYGVNAIFAFVASGLVARLLASITITPAGAPSPIPLNRLIYEHVFATWLSPIDASLAYAIATVLLWWVVCWVLWVKGRLFKV